MVHLRIVKCGRSLAERPRGHIFRGLYRGLKRCSRPGFDRPGPAGLGMRAQRRVTTPPHREVEVVTNSLRLDSVCRQIDPFRESPPGVWWRIVVPLTRRICSVSSPSAPLLSGLPGTGFVLF